MPELPEVHTIVSDLKGTLVGYTITGVVVDQKYNKISDKPRFISNLINKKILNVNRVAKNIVINLDDASFLIIHLAMTGRILIKDENKKPFWVKATFRLKKNSDQKFLFFSDVRMFGNIYITDNVGYKTLQSKYGPEPLDENFNLQEFAKYLAKTKKPIKTVLLDQSVVSGLGNIYATDTLFMSKIHPLKPSNQLKPGQIKNLYESAKKILNEGILHRGSTLGDKMYVDAFGKEGSHQNYFRIYNKANCPMCGTKVEVIKINGRSTYFCPNDQRLE